MSIIGRAITFGGGTDTSEDTVVAGVLLNGYTAHDANGDPVTGNIPTKTSSDMEASGATVTAPAGYYASAQSKSVASGSATTPATSITANPTISVNASGQISASVSASQSVTPSVSAGYVASGTAGTVSVSGSATQQLSTQAGTTITPTGSEQTAVAAGKYTTGAVKVAAIPGTAISGTYAERTIGPNMSIPTALSAAKSQPVGAANSAYAFIAGGTVNNTGSLTVEAYDGTTLTKSTAPDLSAQMGGGNYAMSGSMPNYALIVSGGGGTTVNAYNTSKTRSIPTAMNSQHPFGASGSNDSYTLFAGGGASAVLSNVDAYNASLTRSTPTALSVGRTYLKGTSAGQSMFFAGGQAYSGGYQQYFNTVDMYNSSLTRSTPSTLGVACMYHAGASTGDYAVFAGGYDGSNYLTYVTAFNSSGTRTIPAALKKRRTEILGAKCGSGALFAGGREVNASTNQLEYSDSVERYGNTLTHESVGSLSKPKFDGAAATVGNCAIFSGGYSGTNEITNITNAYTEQTVLALTLTTGESAFDGHSGSISGYVTTSIPGGEPDPFEEDF